MRRLIESADTNMLPEQLEKVLQQVQANADYMPDWQLEVSRPLRNRPHGLIVLDSVSFVRN